MTMQRRSPMTPSAAKAAGAGRTFRGAQPPSLRRHLQHDHLGIRSELKSTHVRLP